MHAPRMRKKLSAGCGLQRSTGDCGNAVGAKYVTPCKQRSPADAGLKGWQVQSAPSERKSQLLPRWAHDAASSTQYAILYTPCALIPTWRARTALALAFVDGGALCGSSLGPQVLAAGVMVRVLWKGECAWRQCLKETADGCFDDNSRSVQPGWSLAWQMARLTALCFVLRPLPWPFFRRLNTVVSVDRFCVTPTSGRPGIRSSPSVLCTQFLPPYTPPHTPNMLLLSEHIPGGCSTAPKSTVRCP